MPEFEVTRTLYFKAEQTLKVQAEDENDAVVEGESWNRGDPLPEGLQFSEALVELITDAEGNQVHNA